MKRTAVLALGVALLASTSVFAQSPPDVSDMINQLVPADAKTAPTETGDSVLTVQGASRDEIVKRLGFSATRSIGTQPGAPLPPFTKGREVEVLRALNGRPSVQVAVAFQGASDALAPESGALLGALGQALSDPKVASSRILIGVHTNSVGSDEYNLDLSQLRAKAIADTLALGFGVAHDRLIPFGFGRAVENGSQNGTADERIQVVNLGAVAVAPVPERPVIAPPSVASVPPRPHLERPIVQRPVVVQ
jgi:outer membrane protein OmpA-like peptidoglycan-associated protein